MRRVLLSVAVVVTAIAGCKHHARKVGCNDCVGLGDPIPYGGGGRITPTEVPLAPRVIPQPTHVPDTRNYSPSPSVTTPSLPPREILLPPERPISRPSAAPKAMPARSDSNTTRGLPSQEGLPGYTPVAGVTQVAAGRKPTPAGFDTLKRDGFKSILYVHAPGTDTTAAAELAASRGLKLTPLPVAPETLPNDLRAFTRQLADPANRPLYVVDESGVRAGSLWYLYFRTHDYNGDEAARVRATPLGLPGDANTEQAKTFWIAVQKALIGG